MTIVGELLSVVSRVKVASVRHFITGVSGKNFEGSCILNPAAYRSLTCHREINLWNHRTRKRPETDQKILYIEIDARERYEMRWYIGRATQALEVMILRVLHVEMVVKITGDSFEASSSPSFNSTEFAHSEVPREARELGFI